MPLLIHFLFAHRWYIHEMPIRDIRFVSNHQYICLLYYVSSCYFIPFSTNFWSAALPLALCMEKI